MMIEEVGDTEMATLKRFDAIIDVRAPDEFAEDHIPGAINLPVLTDAERAEIGTVYKQQSQFRARRIGAAYVACNVARHLETALADKPADFHPLVQCWRGGMRSNAMATILSQVGWRTGVLKGGYKTWRRAVAGAMRTEDGPPLNLVLLDGQTGTAKSDILRLLARRGVQTIDLEALANHRGSVFGHVGAQPSQKLFESHLFETLRRLDPARPILVEAESNRIGRCEVPMRLWSAMRRAPRLGVSAPVAARADYLLQTYAEITEDGARIYDAIDRLTPFHPKETIAQWRVWAKERAYRPLAEALMREHYDPLYDRSRKRHAGDARPPLMIDEFGNATLEAVADEIVSALKDYENQGIYA